MRPQRQADEILVLHDGLAAHLAVPRPEGVRQPLDVDADHDEVVEGEPVAHLLEGLGQLRVLDESAPVSVDTLEQSFSLIDEVEQAGELLNVDLTRLVPVEHVHHYPAPEGPPRPPERKFTLVFYVSFRNLIH